MGEQSPRDQDSKAMLDTVLDAEPQDDAQHGELPYPPFLDAFSSEDNLEELMHEAEDHRQQVLYPARQRPHPFDTMTPGEMVRESLRHADMLAEFVPLNARLLEPSEQTATVGVEDVLVQSGIRYRPNDARPRDARMPPYTSSIAQQGSIQQPSRPSVSSPPALASMKAQHCLELPEGNDPSSGNPPAGTASMPRQKLSFHCGEDGCNTHRDAGAGRKYSAICEHYRQRHPFVTFDSRRMIATSTGERSGRMPPVQGG